MGPNETILRDAYKGYGNGDSDAVFAILADGIVWTSPLVQGRPLSPKASLGVAAVRENLAAMVAEWALCEHTVLDVASEDDRRFEVHVLVDAEYRRTKRHVRIEKVDHVTMEAGKWTSYEETFDLAPLELAMLGT